jgi:nitrous oxidase accessory protein
MKRNHGMILMGIALLVFCTFAGTVSAATTWYVDDDGGADFTTIQEAVNYASAGDTIIVRDGNYGGAYVNTSHLTIRSENGAAHCIIDAAGGYSAFEVHENEYNWPWIIDYVNISGFTVTGGSKGIYLLGECKNNTITNNIISNNEIGVCIDYADNYGDNSITNNIISNNSFIGIALWYSHHNTVANNYLSGNGVTGWGDIDVHTYRNNIITNNTIAEGGRIQLCSMTTGNIITNNIMLDGGASR